MPPEAPLAMPVQDLSTAPEPRPLPRERLAVYLARAFVFGFALAATGALGAVIWDWFRPMGLSGIEVAIIALAMFTAFWIVLSVANAVLGCPPQRKSPAGTSRPLDIAILLPIYGEDPQTLARSIAAMRADILREGGGHRHSLYILSDTRDPQAIAAERRVFEILPNTPDLPLYYRHRTHNDRFKAGNIADWVRRWGGAHEAMLVLDADSVMSGRAVRMLADRMAADPDLGLVQSIPRLVGAQSWFARAQAFANTVYGTTMARGLALWSGTSANYWGHNALIRTRAFAEAAGLPDLPGRRPFGGVILSHDFVEAAFLRRAGWKVAFEPQATESYETTPQTVIAHVLRDRRWCQGNLQHLRLIFSRSLHPLSRIHLFHGAMSYIASFGWFGLMVLWVLVGSGQGDGVVRYFTPANPLFPSWPEMDLVSKVLILSLIYGSLIAPKVLGAIMFWIADPDLRSAGGPLRFAMSWLAEVLLSVLLAPMMMVQHMSAVIRTLTGSDTGWTPRVDAAPGLLTCLRFHLAEAILGLGMAALFITGELSLWLAPIGLCLIMAPVLSWTLSRTAGAGVLMLTPQEIAPPRVLLEALVRVPEKGMAPHIEGTAPEATATA